MNKTTSIKSTKNDRYFRVEYQGKVLGAYWESSSGEWLVQSWGGSLAETVSASTAPEAIALIEKSYGI